MTVKDLKYIQKVDIWVTFDEYIFKKDGFLVVIYKNRLKHVITNKGEYELRVWETTGTKCFLRKTHLEKL